MPRVMEERGPRLRSSVTGHTRQWLKRLLLANSFLPLTISFNQDDIEDAGSNRRVDEKVKTEGEPWLAMRSDLFDSTL